MNNPFQDPYLQPGVTDADTDNEEVKEYEEPDDTSDEDI